MGTWSHQNAYRRRRYLEQTMGRSLLGEQVRGPNAKGRRTCLAQPDPNDPKRRCGHDPVAGMDYCRFHGGATPQAQRLASIRHSYRKARQIVGDMVKRKDFVVPPGQTLNSLLQRATKKDPREVLLQQVHEAAAMAAATREMAGDIDVDALKDPENEGHSKAKQTHELFQTWNLQAMKASKQALDVGIDEQMVRLAEMQARAMVGLLKKVLAADVLQLTPAQQKVAQSLLGQGLRDMIPDVATTPTYELHVDGEVLPYNEALDHMTVGIDIMKDDHRALNHSTTMARRRERARIDRRRDGGESDPAIGSSVVAAGGGE